MSSSRVFASHAIQGQEASEMSVASPTSSAGTLGSKRDRKQRRMLNRVAVYLPQPLKPIASSTTRLFGTLAASSIILFLCLSLLNSHNASEALKFADLPTAVESNSSPDYKPPAYQRKQRQKKRDQVPLNAQRSNERDSTSHAQAVLQDGDGTNGEESSHHQKTKIEIKEVDKCGTQGCNTCGTRGCDPEGYLRGHETIKHSEPRLHFRDNLRKDMKYLTFGMMNGFTNQFLAQVNGIYLAKLSDRVPILPPFAASQHMDRHAAGYLAFSKIFDVPRLQTLLRHPVTNWEDIKISAEQNPALYQPPNKQLTDEKERGKAIRAIAKEKLSCWSLWAAQMPEPGKPAGSAVQNHLGLDVEYWQAPLHYSKPPQDRHIRYWDLVMLDKDIDNSRTKQLAIVAKAKREAMGKAIVINKELAAPPDEQLLCFDTVYYTAATSPQEWWQPHAPVWKAVGRYARWNPDVTKLADQYIRSALAIEDGVRTPNFVSIHIRRGDFSKWCKDGVTDGCLASLDMYKKAVSRVRDELLEKRGVYARWVIVTTDEKDPKYFEAINKLGWHAIDHADLETAEKYGLWWEIVLDAAIQSKGSAFVGTDRSMMSLVSAKRVEEWNYGSTELIKWGPGVH